MIILKNIEKGYQDKNQGKKSILHIPFMQIEAGEQVVITGASGSGKSTLLHTISGVLEIDSGSVFIGDTQLNMLKNEERDQFRAKYIGYIFQDFHLIPSLTAAENVLLALPRKLAKQEQAQLLQNWFERVGLDDRKNALPHTLSRGEQQRVALIRALIHEPPIILADEPTGSLDINHAESMMELMMEICIEKKATFICVTHDLALANKFKRQINMQELNKIIRQGA